MHEMSVAMAVVCQVEEAARAHDADGVETVTLRVGAHALPHRPVMPRQATPPTLRPRVSSPGTRTRPHTPAPAHVRG
ncbi:hydrogenase/urease maturation nickel metallochaperone HypA [Streptomyces albus subsp. chlorinus]